MPSPLDNIIWNSLVGTQARYASGAGGARRYARGYSPLVGFASPARPQFDALLPYCESGERFYCSGWAGPVPSGWRLESEGQMQLMLWDGDAALAQASRGPQPAARPLRPEHAVQAVELAALTRPGPFGPRTIELGDYLGVFEGQRLVAMAGERMQAGSLREISGVCTHPQFKGRGHAQGLMLRLLGQQRRRGETPFLHVMSDNLGARRLYRRLGFRDYLEAVVRVVVRC